MEPRGILISQSPLSSNPLVRIHRYDYHLSPAQPVSVHLRSGEQTPRTLYNVHAGLEIGIMLSGQEDRFFLNLTLPVGAGDVWLAAMWEMHGLRRSEQAARVVVVTFLPEFLGEAAFLGLPWLHPFAVPPDRRPRVREPDTRRRVLALGEEIWREFEAQAPGWPDLVRLHLLILLALLIRDWQASGQVVDMVQDRGTRLQRIMPVLAAISTDPCARRSLGAAAAECSLSPWHFNRLFRQTMGVSFGKFQLRERVVAASHLLLSTDLGVEAIAGQANFSSAGHFHRVFVKQYGCAPGAYRRRFRE